MENAKDVLPASLLAEVQKYAEGKTLYIPKRNKAKGWGEASGYREKLSKRNTMICTRYSTGASIMEIAEEFFLSPETVKKIVYGKKMNLPEYSSSVCSAEHYSNAGLGEEWVRIYLSSLNVEMPDSTEYFLSELVKIPLRLIEAEAEDVTFPDGRNTMDFPDIPLIVRFTGHRFRVLCRREHLDSLRTEKKNSHYAFIFVNNQEYSYYLNNFGKQFQR
ncbi:MAG: hypothetical protein K6E85_05615 [Lachnospiraceae bacterium]|nr:hypothetical protein [Lachnospiraceae bacterium]